jgi:hypothetical protein
MRSEFESKRRSATPGCQGYLHAHIIGKEF